MDNLKAFIDKIENNIAEIHFYNSQTIYINIKFLPPGIKEGIHLDIKFILNQSNTKEIKKSTKDLINELSSPINLQL